MQTYLDIAKQALQHHKAKSEEREPGDANNEFNEFNEVNGSRAVSDGQPPPLDRPPQTEQELRRLIDHLADPEAFSRWLEWAMDYTDPAEGVQVHHQRHVGADSQADADNNL